MSGDAFARSRELFAPWNGHLHLDGRALPRHAMARRAARSRSRDSSSSPAAAGSPAPSCTALPRSGPTSRTTPRRDVVITGSVGSLWKTVSLLLHGRCPRPTTPLLAPWRTRMATSATAFQPEEHDAGVTFYLTASGAVSQAQTTFTDDAACEESRTGTACPDDGNPCTRDVCSGNQCTPRRATWGPPAAPRPECADPAETCNGSSAAVRPMPRARGTDCRASAVPGPFRDPATGRAPPVQPTR